MQKAFEPGIRLYLLILGCLSILTLIVIGCQCTTEQPIPHDGLVDERLVLAPIDLSEGEKLQVVATTSIVADVVENVGGDMIDLTMLLPLGSDPHAFEPSPQDVAAVNKAHVVFINGAGLEAFLEPLLSSAGGDAALVSVSDGIELLEIEGEHHDEHQHAADPHVWFNPNNVIIWTQNIARSLSELDPAHAETYTANAQTYADTLEMLDTWIEEQVALVPEANRKLVTDHASFGYFAHRYGFEQIGTVFPGYNTLAEPSAQEMVALEEAINAHDIHAVFVGLSINPSLAERLTKDTGTRIVFLYTGSLSEPDGPAGDYISLIKYDVQAIVEALQ
jgi:ABC-type Zn uptake system ZnuABC Zn-binding protein ZnuA